MNKKAGIQLKKRSKQSVKLIKNTFTPNLKNIVNKTWGEDVDYFEYLF